MRLSLKRGAHAVLSRAAYRKFGASRSFFARCGIPQSFPSNLSRTPQLHTGALRSHQRTWAENDGRSPTTAFNHPCTCRRVPHISDFLCSFVDSLNFMRLSLKRGAHAVLSRAAYRKFGASRSFFARCGIPQPFPSNLIRTPQLHTGALRSHQRTWAENDGRSPTTAFNHPCSSPGAPSFARFAKGGISERSPQAF
jgi:hypothetical protein